MATEHKPIDPKGLTVEARAKLKLLSPELWAEMESTRHVNIWLEKFVTVYDDMLELKDQVRILADVDDTVLIQGETGTGKELLANALHGDRSNNGGKFIAINCAGIPETLIESTLFGHKSGAFTGSSKEDRSGVFQMAYNGTVFLDEIGELSMAIQAKLLRALQERVITKVGAEEKDTIPINCRFVAATHKNLDDLIRIGSFREDLYWRISTFVLVTKPLRTRAKDIPAIVKRLIIKERGGCKYDIEDIEEFCKPILDALKSGEKLSGNVRQLEQIVRRYHVLGLMPKF